KPITPTPANNASTNRQERHVTNVRLPDQDVSRLLNRIKNAVCCNHKQIRPDYICTSCVTGFCRVCMQMVDNYSITLCRVCGGVCQTYKDALISADRNSKFGMDDLRSALSYPLKSMMSGAVFYAVGFLTGIFLSDMIVAGYARMIEVFLSSIVP